MEKVPAKQIHWGTNSLLCPLHISRSDAPIGLRCSRRQFGTKPSDVASAHHSHWPNGAQCVHSRRLVRESRTILYDSLVGTMKEGWSVVTSRSFATRWQRASWFYTKEASSSSVQLPWTTRIISMEEIDFLVVVLLTR